ncbi:hypothetical protein B0H11DRAFT_2000767 [Mycena galericulata]|nr:hypothetical protein B0H11DRAFT_2000767 [Mycena galericulata]
MSRSGRKSSKKSKPSQDWEQNGGVGIKEYEQATLRFCSMVECFNHQNLKQYIELTDGEPMFQRNLRHWAARFDATLLNACIRGLNLKYEWERIGQGALLITMEPRPHSNVGARWRIQNAGMFRNEDIMEVLENAGMADQYRNEVLPLHRKERERLQKRSRGTADYAAVIMMAGNVGPDALDGDHAPMMRFKPIDISQSMVAKMPIEKYKGDWCQDLKNQVHDDRPSKHVMGKMYIISS